MSELKFEFDNLLVPPGILATLQSVFVAAALNSGALNIGVLTHAPDMIYLLWHLEGEMPISAVLPRAELADEKSAAGFLLRWNQRDL